MVVGSISLILFPVTIYYLSPVIPLRGLSEGLISGAFLVFAGLFFFAVFFGRVFCGWLCPVGAFQDFLLPDGNDTLKAKNSMSPAKLRRRTRRTTVVRLGVFTLWLSAIAIILYRSGFPRRVVPGFGTKNGVSVIDFHGIIVLFTVLLVFAVLTFLLGKRGGCRSICWISPFMQAGTWIGRRLGLTRPSLRFEPQKSCSSCSVCTESCPMALLPKRVAAGYESFDCILCARCVDKCPNSSLHIDYLGRQKFKIIGITLLVLQALSPLPATADNTQENDFTRQNYFTIGFAWSGQSQLNAELTQRKTNSLCLRWTGSVPLTEEREAFSPELGIGAGIGDRRRGRAALWIDTSWARIPYADDKRGIASLGTGVSIHRCVSSESKDLRAGLRVTVKQPFFESTEEIDIMPGDIQTKAALYTESEEWMLSLGILYCTNAYSEIYGGEPMAGILPSISFKRILGSVK